jgi:alpha-beta hydrolase superfamily lysophospholipase
MPITEAASRLAPLFVRRGFAFFYPFRRGHGPSAPAAPFLQDLLARQEREHRAEARQKLQDTLLETEQLDDVLAALTFLEQAPRIDRGRIVLAGHSFGGALTLLAAARDPSIRAAVTFAAAAGSWSRSAEMRRALREAVARAHCPILLVQWSNDFSTEPSVALSEETGPGNPARRMLLYPPLGTTPEQGHNGLYLATSRWEPDVFAFLDDALSR